MILSLKYENWLPPYWGNACNRYENGLACSSRAGGNNAIRIGTDKLEQFRKNVLYRRRHY